MPAAVFGDFLAAATERLESGDLVGDQPPARLPAITRGLSHLVAVMQRYCDDLAPCDEIQARSRDDLRPWELAAVDAGSALRLAAACLRRADQAASDRPATPSRQARLLEAAAADLTAGRDLLETHRATDPAGLWGGRSEWAPVVTSLPFTRGLANEIARWSRQLASFTAQLASAAISHTGPCALDNDFLAALHAELSNASQSLLAVTAAVRPALEIEPVLASDAELLRAIPAAMVQPRQQPGTGAETIPELCNGIAVSASRLRSGVHRSRERARWSPDVTSAGWQWMAQAAAVTSHLGEMALRSLATRAAELPSTTIREPQIRAAADLVADMRAAWQKVDRAWDALMTESTQMPAAVLSDASDLVLRIGRLTWDDPQWTPARSRRAAPRPAAAMVPDADGAKAVIAAVHQSVDAMTVVARFDGEAVRSAFAAGRLYVPTRTLPARYDVPRPFAPAPDSRFRALRETYDSALDASHDATRALGELAVTAGSASRVLAFARAAALEQSNRQGSPTGLDRAISRNPLPASTPFTHVRTTTGQAGPVEQTIRDRGISEPIALLRAAAIDDAASHLIKEAWRETHPASPTREALTAEQHPAVSEVQLAAQSFPVGPAGRPQSQQLPAPVVRSTQGASGRTRRPRSV